MHLYFWNSLIEKKQPQKKIVSKKDKDKGIILPRKKPLIAGSKKLKH